MCTISNQISELIINSDRRKKYYLTKFGQYLEVECGKPYVPYSIMWNTNDEGIPYSIMGSNSCFSSLIPQIL